MRFACIALLISTSVLQATGPSALPILRPAPDFTITYPGEQKQALNKYRGKVVALDEVKPRIQELLTEQHIDELLDAWLHNLRQQADIHSTVTIPGVNAPEGESRAAGVN